MMKKIYDGTWDSIRTHELPEWYQDCKLGIFIHWGIYSVPAYAPRTWELGEVPEMSSGSAIIPMRSGTTIP